MRHSRHHGSRASWENRNIAAPYFTYPAPWNTLDIAATLSLIWLATSLLFVRSRSLLAVIVFDNIMAVIGFTRHGLTLPQSALDGWLLAAFALAGFLLVFQLARR